MITKEFIDQQRERIARKITHIESDIDQTRQFDDIGSAPEDEALEVEEFGEKAALAKDLSQELDELKKALKRIDEGKYGICEKCGGQIETARLEAYPQSNLCANDK